MRALRRRLLVATLCLAVSVFLSAGVSYAKTSSSKVKAKKVTIEKVKVKAELEPCGVVDPTTSPCDPSAPIESDADGTAEREKQSRNGVVKKDEFKGKVKIPVDLGSQLGIIDEATAEGADIRMILSRDDGTGLFTDFAECRLAFDEIEMEDEVDDEEDSEAYAEYKVDVRIKKGTVQAKKGVCDVNLTNVDEAGNAIIDSGVPDAKANDVATATLVDPTETDKNPADRLLDIDFLQGTFVSH